MRMPFQALRAGRAARRRLPHPRPLPPAGAVARPVPPAGAAPCAGAGLRQGGLPLPAGRRPPGKQLPGHRHHRQGADPGQRKIEAAYAAAGRPIDNVRIMSADIERIRSIMTPARHRQPHLHQLLQPLEQKRRLQQAPPDPSAAADPVPGFSWPTAGKSISRPMTTTCSGTAWNTSPQPGTRSSGRRRTCTTRSRPGTSAPSTRGCSPRWGSRSKP